MQAKLARKMYDCIATLAAICTALQNFPLRVITFEPLRPELKLAAEKCPLA